MKNRELHSKSVSFVENKNQNSSAAKSTDNNPEIEREYDYDLKDNKVKSQLRTRTLSREKHGTLVDMIAQFKAEIKGKSKYRDSNELGNNSSGSFILAKTVTETDIIVDALGRTQPKTMKNAEETQEKHNGKIRKKLTYLDASVESVHGRSSKANPTGTRYQDEGHRYHADKQLNSRSHSAGRNKVKIHTKSPDKVVKKKVPINKVKSRGNSREDCGSRLKEKDKTRTTKLPYLGIPTTQQKVFNKKSSRSQMKTENKTKNQSDGNILKKSRLINPLKATLEKELCRGLLKSSRFREGLKSVENDAKNHDEMEKSSNGMCGVSQNQGEKSIHCLGAGGGGKKLDEGKLFSNASIKDSEKVESTKEEQRGHVKLSEVVGGKSEGNMNLSKQSRAVEGLVQRLAKHKLAKLA